MKNNKNIDRLFQEKFRDFEAEPSEQTWLHIQAGLQEEKKEKRIVPVWFKYTGIAAAFLLGFFALNTVFNTSLDTALEQKTAANTSNKQHSLPSKTSSNLPKPQSKTIIKITKHYDNKHEPYQKKSDLISTRSISKVNLSKTHVQNGTKVYQKAHNRTLEEAKIYKTANAEVPVIEVDTPKNAIANSLNQKGTVPEAKDKLNTKITETIPQKQESTTSVVASELEQLLKINKGSKEQIAATPSKNKWEISPNIAAMYLNTNSSGSVIDPELSKNNKTAETGFSYGIGINYALSKKISLRSGLNAFSIGYNTNDVSFVAGLNSKNLANVNYSSNEMIEVQSQASSNALSINEKSIQKTSIGSINQKWGYYEVPLELSYAVLDKKFAVNLIGGFSTLFLKQNDISLISAESNIKLGEASNLNAIHLSTNVGLGFKYQFVKSFQFNFEPMLKYQLNTYSNETGNYKPLFIGLYSGVSYRF